MDKLKYIPGDLVKTILDDKEQVTKVIGYNPTYKEYLLSNKYIYKTRGYISVKKDKIMPIPLTPKILKKNGWELNSATWIYKKGYIKVFKLLDNKTYAAYIFEVRVFEFHFIHELQHLLFGLGINHEMEV